MPINILINKAHDAAAKRDYKEAAKLYGMLLRDSALNERVDLKVRYAFCLEKTGKFSESIKFYQEVIDSHKGSKNVSAIEALESKVSVLRSLSNQSVTPAKSNIKKKQSFTEQMNEAATKDFAGFLALGTTDLSNETTDADSQDQSQLNFASYLSLETQDFTPQEEDDEGTQDLSSFDKY